ncbi:hypothetical protein Naga_101236g2 [Nannochloropsis gaditana]|uniref:Uncharacterized protein n=1 Tax=Nannochloropsis gaditana TaxID=72520 RepID=W7TIR8_9STRA|nr:hypothetical protein Naga_101236g2 [Nannochloropsis gaditana]
MPGRTCVDPSAAVVPQNVLYICVEETIMVDSLRLLQDFVKLMVTSQLFITRVFAGKCKLRNLSEIKNI